MILIPNIFQIRLEYKLSLFFGVNTKTLILVLVFRFNMKSVTLNCISAEIKNRTKPLKVRGLLIVDNRGQ